MAEMFRRMQPGDPFSAFSAGAWNRLCQMGEQHFAGDAAAKAGAGGSGQFPPGVIWIKNDSGEDRGEFEILGIDDILIPPADNESEFRYSPGLVGVTPVDPDHLGKWVVLLEPIADGAIGRARIFGIAPVLLEVNAETDTTADVIDGDGAKLGTMAGGSAEILWKEDGTGEKRALIRFPAPGPPLDCGVLDEDLDTNDPDATATVDDERLTVAPMAKSRLGVILAGMTVQIARYADGTMRVVEGGKARYIEFTVKSLFTTGTGTIEGIYVYGYDGEDPVDVDADIAVENSGGAFRGKVGAHGFARYDPETDTYRAYQFSCVPAGT